MISYSANASETLFDYADLPRELVKLLKRRVDIAEEGFVKPFAIESVNRVKLWLIVMSLNLNHFFYKG